MDEDDSLPPEVQYALSRSARAMESAHRIADTWTNGSSSSRKKGSSSSSSSTTTTASSSRINNNKTKKKLRKKKVDSRNAWTRSSRRPVLMHDIDTGVRPKTVSMGRRNPPPSRRKYAPEIDTIDLSSWSQGSWDSLETKIDNSNPPFSPICTKSSVAQRRGVGVRSSKMKKGGGKNKDSSYNERRHKEEEEKLKRDLNSIDERLKKLGHSQQTALY